MHEHVHVRVPQKPSSHLEEKETGIETQAVDAVSSGVWQI